MYGHNIVKTSNVMPWYRGPSLLEHLETVPVGDDLAAKPFRMPVQWVNRPNLDFRGFTGAVVSGTIRSGDAVRVVPSGRQTKVARILIGDHEAQAATAGESVTLTLTDEIDMSRGDVLATATAPPAVADHFESTIVWMHDRPMLPGRSYLVKIGTKTVTATVTPLKYKINVNTLEIMPVQQAFGPFAVDRG